MAEWIPNEIENIYKVKSIEEILKYNRDFRKYFNVSDSNSYKGLCAFYRGQANSNWKIEPIINRKGCHVNFEGNEIQEVSWKYINEGRTLFDIIAKMQHYGMKTRFIDFTTDIDVALYFACNNKEYINHDASLFIYMYVPHSAESISTLVLTEIALLNIKDAPDKISIREIANKVINHNPSIIKRYESREDFEGTIVSFLDHGFMACPDKRSLEHNSRMWKQKGCFFICGAQATKFIESTDRWSSHAGKVEYYIKVGDIPKSLIRGLALIKLIIPKEIKGDILKYLAEKSIDYDHLFAN